MQHTLVLAPAMRNERGRSLLVQSACWGRHRIFRIFRGGQGKGKEKKSMPKELWNSDSLFVVSPSDDPPLSKFFILPVF